MLLVEDIESKAEPRRGWEKEKKEAKKKNRDAAALSLFPLRLSDESNSFLPFPSIASISTLSEAPADNKEEKKTPLQLLTSAYLLDKLRTELSER